MEQLNLKQVVETADLLKRTLGKLIISDRGVHAETIVAASARMAGTMLLRDLLPDTGHQAPDPAALSDAMQCKAPVLEQTLFATLQHLGHGELDGAGRHACRASTALSRLSLDETQSILEPWYRRTADTSQLSLREVAASAAITTALLIHDCRGELDVHDGCAIATHGFAEPIGAVPAHPCPAA